MGICEGSDARIVWQEILRYYTLREHVRITCIRGMKKQIVLFHIEGVRGQVEYLPELYCCFVKSSEVLHQGHVRGSTEELRRA